MSLKEKWEEYRAKLNEEYPGLRKDGDFSFWLKELKRAFYSGAESYMQATGENIDWEDDCKSHLAIHAEIDHFKAGKP